MYCSIDSVYKKSNYFFEIDSFVEQNREYNHLQYLQVNQYIDHLLISLHFPKNG